MSCNEVESVEGRMKLFYATVWVTMMLEGFPEFAELTYGWWLVTFPGSPVGENIDQNCSPGLGGFWHVSTSPRMAD